MVLENGFSYKSGKTGSGSHGEKRRLKVKMASPRKRRTTVAPQWEVKANWPSGSKHLPIAKAIAQSDIIVRCATQSERACH